MSMNILKRSKVQRVLLGAYCLFGLFGCYTFSGSTLPSHLRTVNVLPIDNKTLQPALAQDLRQAVIDGFNRSSSMRLVPSRGNCDLKLVLKSYDQKPFNISGNDITDYQINLVVGVEFIDNVKNEILFQEENLPGYATYSVTSGETETTGKERAVSALVETILDNTVSGW
jgi:hypothetical protein